MTKQPDLLYVGSYAGTISTVDARESKPKVIATTEGIANPAFLAAHPNGNWLYAIDEADEGSVTAFAIDENDGLKKLNTQSTGGSITAQLVVDPSAKFLLSVNYGSGSVAVHPLNSDGSIGERTDLVQHYGEGPEKERQEGPHAHVVRFAPDGRYALVADLGIDQLITYALADSKLNRVTATQLPPGTGPRHLVFGPDNSVYAVGELDSTIRGFAYDPESGELTAVGVLPATIDQNGVRNYPSEIAISDDGRFCYVANRGRDVITAFAVSGGTVRAKADVPVGGEWPRHLATAGDRLWVANQNSGNLTAYTLDRFGIPQPAGESLQVNAPACILPVVRKGKWS
jgi:6-phosphogluconolactonase